MRLIKLPIRVASESNKWCKENKIYEKGETDNGKVDAISKSSWLHMSAKTTRSHKRLCVKTTCQQKGA